MFRFSVTATAAAILMGMLPSAIGSSAQRVGQYDFTYLTSGEMRATPVQVFDDGQSTYFQFRAGEAIPAIFQNKGGRVDLLVPSFEGPYVRVPDVSGHFTLQLGRAQAQVVYGGAGREGVPPITAVASNGMTTPYRGSDLAPRRNTRLIAALGPALEYLSPDALEANSYATPAKGDKVTWNEGEAKAETVQVMFSRGVAKLGPVAAKVIASSIPALKKATRVTIVGRDDDSYKEGLDASRGQAIRDALIKAGVPTSNITVKTGVALPQEKGLWVSEIRSETVVPTMVSRPDPVGNVERDRAAYVRSSVESLLKAGALTTDQANAILRRGQERGLPATAAAEPTPAPKNAEVPSAGFDFKATDKTISATVRRWAATTNYQIVWDAPAASDAPITGDAVIASASMKEALDKVVTGLQRKGYDIQATVYSNRVIRFTGSTK